MSDVVSSPEESSQDIPPEPPGPYENANGKDVPSVAALLQPSADNLHLPNTETETASSPVCIRPLPLSTTKLTTDPYQDVAKVFVLEDHLIQRLPNPVGSLVGRGEKKPWYVPQLVIPETVTKSSFVRTGIQRGQISWSKKLKCSFPDLFTLTLDPRSFSQQRRA
ncbi:hypothetical protein MW887_010482 [Aspergillus wentii]|nr:hypothetical protein MW887_010482 [Aspergillus wentii]